MNLVFANMHSIEGIENVIKYHFTVEPCAGFEGVLPTVEVTTVLHSNDYREQVALEYHFIPTQLNRELVLMAFYGLLDINKAGNLEWTEYGFRRDLEKEQARDYA